MARPDGLATVLAAAAGDIAAVASAIAAALSVAVALILRKDRNREREPLLAIAVDEMGMKSIW